MKILLLFLESFFLFFFLKVCFSELIIDLQVHQKKLIKKIGFILLGMSESCF